MKSKMTVADYEAKFFLGDEEFNPVVEAMSELVKQNKKETMDLMAPNVEKSMSKRCLEIGNSIIKHVSFEELFPDRE